MLDTRKTLLSAMIVIASGASLNAMAHTGIQLGVTASATTGSTSTTYNNIVIGHGCEDEKGKKRPVIAQSIVFPTVNPDIFEGSSTEASNLTISDIFSSGQANVGIQLIQSKDVFDKLAEKYDSNGNVIGFINTKGNLDVNLHGLVPFRTGAITFKSNTTGSAGGSCVSKVNIKVGIADICNMSFSRKDGPKVGDANLWIPRNTPKFSNSKLDGIGSPATLSISNPACTTNGFEVTISPSDEDIDANLPFKGWGK
jgi:hypothetical protein